MRMFLILMLLTFDCAAWVVYDDLAPVIFSLFQPAALIAVGIGVQMFTLYLGAKTLKNLRGIFTVPNQQPVQQRSAPQSSAPQQQSSPPPQQPVPQQRQPEPWEAGPPPDWEKDHRGSD